MKSESDTIELGRQARIAALIEILHDTEQQLEALTGGEVDAVANHAGRPLLLRSAEEQLRQQEAQKQMALLSALRGEELRCCQAGMDGYLTKPLRLAQLKVAVDAWLRPVPVGPGVAVVVEAASLASSPVDLSVLADLLGDDPQVMRDVLASFRMSTKDSALAMTKARASGVVQGMSDVAHKLKSTARAIGAAHLGQICADIEEAARTPHSAWLDPLVADFEVELRAVHAILEKH